MEILFIDAKYLGDIILPKELINLLPNRIVLATTVQFISKLTNIQFQLNEKSVSLFESTHSNIKGQILGCDIVKEYNVDAFLYVGTGLFHPKAILMNNDKPVFTYDPISNKFNKITKEDINMIEKKRKIALVKFYSSNTIGILVSTKWGQEKLKIAEKLKSKLKNDGKEVYIFLTDYINLNDLNNFPFVESWVNTACPRISFDDSINFSKAILDVSDIKWN